MTNCWWCDKIINKEDRIATLNVTKGNKVINQAIMHETCLPDVMEAANELEASDQMTVQVVNEPIN